MPDANQPSLGFVIGFLLFSLLFFRNTYKLWFKTDEYYEDIYNSLTREPSQRASSLFASPSASSMARVWGPRGQRCKPSLRAERCADRGPHDTRRAMTPVAP